MILTAHQPVYLPWLGLFHKIALADRFVSFNQVQYQPKDWNNRNKVKTSQDLVWLTVPVNRKGYMEKKICDIEINNQVPWGRKHWGTLLNNYGKAPFFKKYADYFEHIYKLEWNSLVELNESMLQWFLDTLGIDIKVERAGDFDFCGEKSGLVLDMCQKLGAEIYIFGAQGRDYADTAAFDAVGIEARFQEYHHPIYPQQHGEFASHISIVDLLFNCGENSLEILLSGNLDRQSYDQT
jgi:hypothetical protein